MKTTLLILCLLLAACTGCDDGGQTSDSPTFGVTHDAPSQTATQWGYNWSCVFTVRNGGGFDGFVVETTINHADGSVQTLVEYAEWRGFDWRHDTQGGASGETRTVVYYPADAAGYVANAEGMAYLPGTAPALDPLPIQGTITKSDRSRAVTFVIDTTGPVVVLR